MSENEKMEPDKTARAFKSSDIFWQKTAMLFMFYWLFRWLCPSVLPESLLTANFQVQMLVCCAGGGVLTILAAISHANGPRTKTDQK